VNYSKGEGQQPEGNGNGKDQEGTHSLVGLVLCNSSNGRAGLRAARAWIVAVLKVSSELYGSPVDNWETGGRHCRQDLSLRQLETVRTENTKARGQSPQ
jgi:hypothetical protein